MSFFCRLSRRHYWCTPHRSADNRLVQVCYECGSERPARELHSEIESIGSRRTAATIDRPRKAMPRVVGQVSAPVASQVPERLAVGQNRTRRFLVVK